jgi:D-beta-D-heptose 7-phosphate kinase/D-beta-D-heptose 1-phosphate adenosyltransferase
VASNIVSLGGKVQVIGGIGDDDSGRWLLEVLDQRNIGRDYMVALRSRPTIHKTRYMVGNYHIMRRDTDKSHMPDIDGDQLGDAAEKLSHAITDFQPDIIYMADYDKGFLAPLLINQVIIESNRAGIPTIVDPKIRHFHCFKGVTVLKPNEVRAGQVYDRPSETESDLHGLAVEGKGCISDTKMVKRHTSLVDS